MSNPDTPSPVPDPSTPLPQAPRSSVVMPQLPPQREHVDEHPTGKRLGILSLTALGIVYGDIGTSPLYAFREGFTGRHGYAPTQENVYGLLSLITWALILVVSVKYLIFVLRADNRGEGGILALLALVLQSERSEADKNKRGILILLGLFGAALLIGDGIITPAISVLSAVEGIGVATPAFDRYVEIITVVVLIGLFSVQRFGTARVGSLFGPLMLLWFLTIGILGVREIAIEPGILAALNPMHGVWFFAHNGAGGFLVLGAVVLAITGGEALYADMGHFGKRPIRVAWFVAVLPFLLANYYGQGALVLRDPTAATNPFYLLAPRALLYPLVGLATVATIVASQALISGSFSLAQQSMQLGYSPRLSIVHTSYKQAGQIYVPEVNAALAVGCVILVMVFEKSENLTAAYGIAVTGTMAITSVLYAVVSRERWHWPLAGVIGLLALFLFIDVAFFAANAVKIASGGWVTIAIAIAVFTVMSTWKTGRSMIMRILQAGSLPLDLFLGDVTRKKPLRVQGTAVFMTSATDGVPVVLLHHLKHNKVLHAQVVLMSIQTEDIPEIPAEERLTVESLGEGFFRVSARYGFMETPDVPEILFRLRQTGLKAKTSDTTFYLGRERVIIADRKRGTRAGTRTAPNSLEMPRMAYWRKELFILLQRNAKSATEFFGIPPNRVVELGAQVEL